MIDLLYKSVECGKSRNWRPHLSQIVAAVDAFGARCREEARGFGCRRGNELDAEDTFELVREQGERLVDWLQRMMAE